MAGSPLAGQGASPWWQQGGVGPNSGAAQEKNFEAQAPPGYYYDPVKMSYVMQPAQAGTDVNQFTTAALGNGPGGTSLTSSLNGLGTAAGVTGSGAGVAAPATGGPVSAGAAIPGVGPIDTSAATSAAFGAAKDQSGQEAQGALASLRGLSAASGLSGSGMEAEGEKGIVENALGEMGSASRANATTIANNAETNAQGNQAAAITQRGQDIAAEEANATLAQQAAALKSQQSLQMLQMALGLLPQLNITGSSNGSASASSSSLY
jgi:hypothetical protein